MSVLGPVEMRTAPEALTAAELVVAQRVADIGAVYVIGSHAGGVVKIGWSRDVETRLRQLQTGNPTELRILAFLPGGPDLEKGLHAEFVDLRERGEWFRDDDCEITEVFDDLLARLRSGALA